MPKRTSAEGALFVRLPAAAVERLDRAAEVLGMRKKDLVAGLLTRYVDPDSPAALSALGGLGGPGPRRISLVAGDGSPARGSYSFQAHEPPEVMNVEQAAELLQVEASVVVDMAQAGTLPGRRLGGAWRFSRAALVAWLSTPER